MGHRQNERMDQIRQGLVLRMLEYSTLSAKAFEWTKFCNEMRTNTGLVISGSIAITTKLTIIPSVLKSSVTAVFFRPVHTDSIALSTSLQIIIVFVDCLLDVVIISLPMLALYGSSFLDAITPPSIVEQPHCGPSARPYPRMLAHLEQLVAQPSLQR